MLRLVKTGVTPEIEQRIFRMFLDARLLTMVTTAEIRAIYPLLKAVRDALSEMLDKVEDTHV